MENLNEKEIRVINELLKIDENIFDKAMRLNELYRKISWGGGEKSEEKVEYSKIYDEVITISCREEELLKYLNSEKVDTYIDYIYTEVYGERKKYFKNDSCKLLNAILRKRHLFRTITLLENMNLDENERKLKTNFTNMLIHYLEPAFVDEAYFYEYCECKYAINVLLAREKNVLFKDVNELQLIECKGVDYKEYIDMFYDCYENINISDFHFDEDEVVVESCISEAIIGAILAMLPENEYNELKGKIAEKIEEIHGDNQKEDKEFKERMDKEGPKDPVTQYLDYYVQSVRTNKYFESMIDCCFERADRDRKNIQIIKEKEYIKNKS